MIARLLCALAVMVATPVRAEAPASQPTPITVGETHRIASRNMGDERTVNVYLPAGYADPAKRFPVLYLIDGGLEQDFLHIAGTSQLGSLWARSEAVIVVGIETKDRRRELVGPTQDVKLLADYPTAGFSAGFRNYIRDEVKPLIEKSYRTTGEDGVIGESLAGLFIVETFLREPSLFDRYAAVSPSLWWDQQRLSGEAAGLLKGRKKANTHLFLTIGDEGAEMQTGVERLLDALAAHPAAAGEYCFAPRPRSTHATIYHDVSPEALQYLFPTSVEPDPQSGFVIACSRKS